MDGAGKAFLLTPGGHIGSILCMVMALVGGYSRQCIFLFTFRCEADRLRRLSMAPQSDDVVAAIVAGCRNVQYELNKQVWQPLEREAA